MFPRSASLCRPLYQCHLAAVYSFNVTFSLDGVFSLRSRLPLTLVCDIETSAWYLMHVLLPRHFLHGDKSCASAIYIKENLYWNTVWLHRNIWSGSLGYLFTIHSEQNSITYNSHSMHLVTAVALSVKARGSLVLVCTSPPSWRRRVYKRT